MGEEGGGLTHHTRWHSARDLVLEHHRCHEDLRTGREARKRAKEAATADRGDAEAPPLKKEKVEDGADEGAGEHGPGANGGAGRSVAG